MLKNVLRKTFSVLLALALILTSVSIAVPASLFLKADASVAVGSSADVSPVTFVVPEAIYLTPVWDSYYMAHEMSFQWYVNNTVNADGTITCDTGEDSIGDIYFYYKDTDSAIIKFEWLDKEGLSSLGGRIKFGDNTERSAGGEYVMTPSATTPIHITSGMSPTMDPNETGAFLRWIATYTDKSDNRVKSVTAYTYVYKPYVQPVGVAIHTLNTRGVNSAGDDISWVSGVHDTDGAAVGGYYPNTKLSSEGKGLMTFSSSFVAGTQVDKLNAQFASTSATNSRFFYDGIADVQADTWLNQTSYPLYVPDKSFNYLKNEESSTGAGGTDNAYVSFSYSPTALLTVDSSRYTNLNQIPNLSIGMMVTQDKGSANSGAWYVANHTGTPATAEIKSVLKNDTANAEALWRSMSNGGMIASVGHYSNGTIAGTKAWVKDAEREGVKYNGRWTRAIGASGVYMVGTMYYNHDGEDASDHYGSDTIWNAAEIRTKINVYNKSSLRAAMQKAVKNAALLDKALFDNSSIYWKNYTELYHAAGLALVKLDGTFSSTVTVSEKSTTYPDPDALATALDTAVEALLSGNGRVKGTITQTNVALQKQADGRYKCVDFLGANDTCTATYVSGQSVTLAPERCPGYTFVGALKTQQPPMINVGAYVTYPSSFTTGTSGAVFAPDGTITYPRTGVAGTDNRGNIYYTFYYLPNAYTVSFDANGGAGASEDQSFIYNDPTALNANQFTKRGYQFAGWAKNPEGTGTIYADKEPVTDLCTEKDGHITLYAVWEKAQYTITLNPAGGTVVGSFDSTYDIETNVVLPNVERSGYTLLYWKANDVGNWGPLTYPVNSPILVGKYGDVTMTAVWKANGYTVAFNGNGATSGNMKDQEFAYGASQSLTANAYARTGYVFQGWAETADATRIQYSDKQVVMNLSGTPGTTVTLYAVWTPSSYTINYNTDGGSIRDAVYSRSYTIESNINLPTDVVKTGYTFDGWESTTNAGNWVIGVKYSESVSAGMYGAVTFNAKWNLAGYNITYKANGGTISGSGYTTSYNASTTITLPTATRSGYTFSGWVADDKGNWGTDTYMPGTVSAGKMGNVVLTAVWSGITYYVAYDGNNSTDGVMFNQTMTYGEPAALSENHFVRTGYTFLGWSASKVATTASYANGATVENLSAVAGTVVTLYAVWSADQFTVTYDAAGGEITTTAYTQSYNVTNTITLPTATRSAYIFSGWKLAEAVEGWNAETVYMGSIPAGTVAGSAKLVAQWEPEQYTITYAANGGEVSGEATYAFNITSTITIPSAVRPGYAFNGWQASGWDNGIYRSGTVTGKTGNVILTAMWTARQYKVHFEGNGAKSGSMADQVFSFDIAQALSANGFVRPGYTFDGWALTAGGAVTYRSGDSVVNLVSAENEVFNLYAVWSGVVFSINYDMNGIGGAMIATSVTMDGAVVNLRENKNLEVQQGEKKYTFQGWALTKADADDGQVALANMADFALTEDMLDTLDVNWAGSRPVIKLYAVWEEVEEPNASIDLETSPVVVAPESGFIYGLPFGVTEQEIVDTYIKVEGKAHLEFDYVGFIGTGTKVSLVSDVNGEVLETYTLVIFGDLNGDGIANNSDLVDMKAINAGLVSVDENPVKAFACDMNNDGEINNSDIVILRNLIAGIITFDQVTREQARA